MGLASQGKLFNSGESTEPQREQSSRQNKPLETPLTVLQRVEQQALKQLKMETPELAKLAAKVIIDPGADISPEDSELWLWLLTAAEKTDTELHARLFYIRGAGAKLERHATYGYSIKPIIDPEGKKGWTSPDEYQRERQCLVAYRNKLIELLRKLGEWRKKEL
jgi:hypothetical protein